jgi:hypothetical protein
MIVKAIDPLTREQFIKLRRNQKFSSAKNRIKYNNNKAYTLRTLLAPYNGELHRTIVVLNELMKGKNSEVFHKQFLLGKGMSFNSFTGCDMLEEKQYFCVYYFIIVPLENNKIKIVRK